METASCFLHGDFDAGLRRCPKCGAGRGSDTKEAAARNSRPTYRYERDYLERTIATVRNHQDSENCWPQWANIFADEIERLWASHESEVVIRRRLEAALVEIIDQSKDEPGGLNFANRAFEIARGALGWETERRFDRLPTPEDGYTGWKS